MIAPASGERGSRRALRIEARQPGLPARLACTWRAGKFSLPAIVASPRGAMAGSRVADGDERSELVLDPDDRPRDRQARLVANSRAETVPQQNRTRPRGKYAATKGRWNCGIGHHPIDPARALRETLKPTPGLGPAAARTTLIRTAKRDQRRAANLPHGPSAVPLRFARELAEFRDRSGTALSCRAVVPVAPAPRRTVRGLRPSTSATCNQLWRPLSARRITS